MKVFKSICGNSNKGDIPLDLYVEAQDEVKYLNEELDPSYGYLLMQLKWADPNFAGCLVMERNTVEELRNALTELLEAYPN